MASVSIQTDYTEFTGVLRHRLDGYFRESHRSSKATPLMKAKIALGLLALVSSYVPIYIWPYSAPRFVALYLLHGLTQLFLLLNLAHDTNHNAIAERRWVNKALSYIFDLCGINSYIWRALHNRGHHPNINIRGDDEDIIARGYIRLSPDTPRHWLHRYQYLYAWFLYGFSTLDYVLVKDFEYFFFNRYRPLKGVRHAKREYVTLFATKLFYYLYMLVLPLLLLGASPLVVAGAFVAMHFVVGLLSQLVFQPSHAIAVNSFPSHKREFDNYTLHIFATTADFSTRSRLSQVFWGGLNYHVAHHLCPSVCHTHYPELTRIVRETASEYRIPYREYPTIWRALADHFRHLKRLGRGS